jgi:ABC-2 type transport system ATP-binding protein
MENLIEARNIYKSFGRTKAVDGLSLNVAGGEIYGLVGPDGAGKTTTLRLLCGALEPDASSSIDKSTIFVNGLDVLRQVDLARAEIGYLPQRFSLYEDLTVLENIRFFAEIRGLSAANWRPRCMEILDFVGLEPFKDRLSGLLSGGMKQKLGLAAALVHEPKVLLLDEPTTGVDPVTRQDFWQLLIRLVIRRNGDGGGVAVLVSTPYMDEAARCNRVGFMRGGNLLVEGAPTELRHRLDGRILELRGAPMALLRRVSLADKDVEAVQMFGDRLHLRVHSGRALEVERRIKINISHQGGVILDMQTIPPQLEDVFISLLE